MSKSEEKDALEKSRIIYFSGHVDEKTSKEFIESLLQYEAEDPFSDVIIYIDSYGGEVYSFMAMHDAIKLCRCDVATVCIGKTMSAGWMTLMSGTRGKRFATPNATILVHAIQSGSYGSVHELDNDIKETKRLQEAVEKMTIKYTNITKKQLRELMSKDSFMDAKQALDYGIIDHIITSPSVLHSKIKMSRGQRE